MDEYLPLRDVVFKTLRQAILKGELEPGERLMEIQLAREALDERPRGRTFTIGCPNTESDLSFCWVIAVSLRPCSARIPGT